MFLVVDSDKNIDELDKSLGKPSNPSQIVHLLIKSDLSNQTADLSRCFVINGLKELLNDAEHRVNKFFAQCLEEMSVKLIVNAVSTGAHVLIGKSYENLMIDVRVSNFKLYNRAISIIQKLATSKNMASCLIEKEECEAYLLRSIYKDKELPAAILNNIQAHIAAATSQQQIVPKALVMLLAKVSEAEADRLLSEANGSVRNCIFNLKPSK